MGGLLMQCDLDALSLYIDGELGAPRRYALEQHLTACAECRAVLNDLRENDRVLVQWGSAREPVPVSTQVRIERSLRPASALNRLLSLSRMMPAAVGTTVAAVLVLASTSLTPLLGARPAPSALSQSRSMARLIATQSVPLLNARRTSALLPGHDTTQSSALAHRTIQFDIE